MEVLRNKKILILLLAFTMPTHPPRAMAQTVNLSNWGLNTGFELGQDSKGITHNISDQAVFGLVRDGINWADIETSPGVYSMPVTYQAYLNNIQAAGLKLVALFPSGSCNPPPWYMNTASGYAWPTDAAGQAKIQAALANFCAWLVRNEPMISVVELFNEPNNYFHSQGMNFTTAQWEQIVVSCTSTVTGAVHAANPSVKVASLGGQGQQVLDMIKMTPAVDIVVAHTYPTPNVPERYDNGTGGMDYTQWTQSVYSAIADAYPSNRPQYWETEWAAWRQGNDPNSEEYLSAVFDSHRFPLALSLGIPVSIRFQALDPDPAQSEWNDREEPRQVSFVHERIADLLNGLSPVSAQSANVVATTTGSLPSGAAVYSPVFSTSDGSTTSLITWVGNVLYGGIGWSLSYTISLNYSGIAQSVTAENLVTGEIWHPKWSQGGSNVTISGAEIGSEAICYTISNTGGSPVGVSSATIIAGSSGQTMTVGSDVYSFGVSDGVWGYEILKNGVYVVKHGFLLVSDKNTLYTYSNGAWYSSTSGTSWQQLASAPAF